ncbi:Oligopeptide-binding protein AppA [Planctomycetales bacterium 10988]|nr:Oligopeptide-binding protein AppA [Planctomycetales bacterium 10988]
MKNYSLFLLVGLLPALLLQGCTFEYKTNSVDDEPFELGDMIEPFDPPTLEELDKEVTWEDGLVIDAMKLDFEAQEKMGEPPINIEEALKLKNKTPEDNEKILDTLGRLPESEEEVDFDGEMIRHTSAELKSTNPLLISSTAEFDIASLTSFGLFSFDRELKPFAAADSVKEWKRSEDRLYDKIVMRDDLLWSDGKPITAHDIVFSWRLIMSSQVPVPAVRSGTDKLKWIEAYDDYTLVFFHPVPLATNIWNVNFPIVPKHVYENSVAEDPTLQTSPYHVKIEEKPVVGGAYEIVERSVGNRIVLQSREDYYMFKGKQVRDKPYFKRIVYRIILDPAVTLQALMSAEIEEAILTPEQWSSNTNGGEFYKHNTKAYGAEWTYFYFGWNTKTPYFSDKRVRQAMSYAFNHDELLNVLLYGLCDPSTGTFHPQSPWYPEEGLKPYKRDLKKAEKLLEEAGWVDSNGDGKRDKEVNGKRLDFKFTILVMNRPDRVDVCNLLSNNLKDIGIDCVVRPVEFTTLQQYTSEHKFQAFFGGWGAGADPDTSENIWGTDQERNYGQYSNEQVDKLFEEGRKEFDEEKRQKIYQEIHKIIYEDQPYTFLYTRNAYYGFNKKLRGYAFSPRGPYHYGPGFSRMWTPLK